MPGTFAPGSAEALAGAAQALLATGVRIADGARAPLTPQPVA